MKMIKRAAAAITAMAMMASASAAVFPSFRVMDNVPVVSAEETKGYEISLSESLYNINSLKTLAYYKQNELYYTDQENPAVENGDLDSNSVAAVKLSFTENYGFSGATIVLDFDEELTFVGLETYSADSISANEELTDYTQVTSKRGRILVNYKTGFNFTGEGECFKLLFALPATPELDHVYRVAINDDVTSQQIVPWEDGITPEYSSKSGYILLTDAELPEETTPAPAVTEVTTTVEETTTTEATTTTTEATTTEATTTEVTTTEVTTTTVVTTVTEPPVTTPEVTTTPANLMGIIIDAGKNDNVKEPVANGDTIEFEGSSSIDIDVPKQMKIRDGLSQVELQVNLKDFDAEKNSFSFAGFGFDMPEGFSIAEVKPAVTADTQIYNAGSEKADKIKAYSMITGLSENADYVLFNVIDTTSLGADANLFNVVVNVPAEGVDFVNDITVKGIYGRITDAKTNEDGSVTPYVSLFKKGSSIYIGTAETQLLTVLRGDADLDGKVTQLDANLILKEILARDAGSTVLDKEVNMEAAGEDSIALSKLAGDVDSSANGEKAEQPDVNCILKAILYADATPERQITPEIWVKAIG